MTTATQEKAQALVKGVSLLPAKRLTPKDVNDGSIPTLHRALVLRIPQAMEVSQALAQINGRPYGDKILVLPLPRDQRFGSIIIPDNAQEDQMCGIVVSVGKGHYENGVLIPCEAMRGDYVQFSKYSSRSFKVGDIELMQLSEQDVVFGAGTDGPEETS
jgi:chaperonin GroES